MRSFITTIAIFLTIIITITFGSIYVKKNTSKLEEQINTVFQAVYDKDWDYAEKAFDLMSEELEKSSHVFEAMYDHDEVDQLKTPQTRAESYISQRHAQEALTELMVLKDLIRHLSEKDKLIFYNVL